MQKKKTTAREHDQRHEFTGRCKHLPRLSGDPNLDIKSFAGHQDGGISLDDMQIYSTKLDGRVFQIVQKYRMGKRVPI
jgi:hypothetical protein